MQLSRQDFGRARRKFRPHPNPFRCWALLVKGHRNRPAQCEQTRRMNSHFCGKHLHLEAECDAYIQYMNGETTDEHE